MSVASVIRDLVAAGVPLEHALLAAEKFEAQHAEEAAAAAQVVVSATPRQLRNARYYEENKERLRTTRRLKASENASETLNKDVSVVSDAEKTEQPETEKEGPPHPLRKTTTSTHHPSDDCPSPKKSKGQPTAKPSPISPDFWPSEADFAVVCSAGMTRQVAEAKVRSVVNYWIGRHEDNPRDPKAKKVNWGRAFQNSCLSDIQRFGPSGTGGRPPPNGGGGGRSRYAGPSMADLASVNSTNDLFRSVPDEPRDHHPVDRRPDPADARVPGFAGRLREPDRDDAHGNVFDLQRAGSGWR
jgi:hypothetical protein